MKGLLNWAFGYGPPHALAGFRMVFGFISALSFVTLLIALTVDPIIAVPGAADARNDLRNPGSSLPFLSLLGSSDSVFALRAVVALGVLASILTMIGWRTRIATAVLALVSVTIAHRLPMALMGADSVQRACALVLPFSACGAVWSLDARGKTVDDVPLWPQRLLQFQCALIYGTTLLIKAQGATWREGTATWYPLRLDGYARFPMPDFLKTEAMSRATTYGTLLIEFALCALVWFRPWRTPVLLAGLAMHLAIDYAMNLPFFAFFMIAMYGLYYDGEEWRRRFQKRSA